MQKLLKAPEKLSIGEISKRLKENPEDSVVLKEITDVIDTQRPRFTIVVQAFREAIEYSDSFKLQSSILVEAYQKLPQTINFYNEISKSFKRVLLDLSKTLNQLIDSVINFNKMPLLLGPAIEGLLVAPNQMINNLQASTKRSLFDDIDLPSIGYIEPKPNYTPILMRIENQLERITDDSTHPQITRSNPDPRELLDLFPENNGKTKVLNKIMKLLLDKPRRDVYHVIQCIYTGLKRTDFERKKQFYLNKLENKSRALNRNLKPFRLFVSIKSGFCLLVRRNQLFD